ncbi:hypothetical protein BH10PSE17_BH10PSE17_36710 [soil metagenome]
MTSPRVASSTHLVLIPSYDTGPKLRETILAARAQWSPVWVVIDGSTDGSAAEAHALAASDDGLRVIELPVNQGKGAAVMHGLDLAQAAGFTHALTMDSDGQHPADLIGAFMQASMDKPWAMILGHPVFDASAPRLRVYGRRLSNGWTHLWTLFGGVADSLYGFRVYPIDGLLDIMRRHRFMRRFDFDPEAAVRLFWRGVVPINVPAPVRYLTAAEGGVSHFQYVRDNILLSTMHMRLLMGTLWRLPSLLARRAAHRPPFGPPR